jgi:serpin B
MEDTTVDVLLPRFRMESDKRLDQPLMRLGMTDAFDPWRANFSELTPKQVFIAFVRQKSFVEVDEEGTEAAAVTAVGFQLVCAGCGPVYPVVQLDRPFFFAILDNATGTVLFLGQVMDPTAG